MHYSQQEIKPILTTLNKNKYYEKFSYQDSKSKYSLKFSFGITKNVKFSILLIQGHVQFLVDGVEINELSAAVVNMQHLRQILETKKIKIENQFNMLIRD